MDWQPIETAPKDGRIIMGWIGVPWFFFWDSEAREPAWCGVVPNEDGYAEMWLRSVDRNQPTHWAIPPEGPEELA